MIAEPKKFAQNEAPVANTTQMKMAIATVAPSHLSYLGSHHTFQKTRAHLVLRATVRKDCMSMAKQSSTFKDTYPVPHGEAR